jgi:NHL repeat-containing protein
VKPVARLMTRVLPVAAAGLIAGTAAAGTAAAGTGPGFITTVAGGPGRGPAWSVAQRPVSVAVGPGGGVYVGDESGIVHEFGAASTWEKVVAGVGAAQSGGHYGGDGRPAVWAHLGNVSGLAVDGSGDVLIADPGNERIRVVAAVTGTLYGQPVTAGDIYTVAGNGTGGFSGDGGPATAAMLSSPLAVAADPAGNLVIADTGNNGIRAVAATSGTYFGRPMTAGDIYTVATVFGLRGIAADAAGNVIYTSGSQVWVLAGADGTFYGHAMSAGVSYRIAGTGLQGFAGDGGPAVYAELARPAAVAVDPAGNLVVADTGNSRLRVVAAVSGTFYGQAMTAGDIYTVAGNGARGYSGDGGPALAAGLPSPSGVAADPAGNLLVTSGNRVRAVAAATGGFYEQAMTAGQIYRVAGRALPLSGDRRLARNAVLPNPIGIAVDGTGDIAVFDRCEVRLVAASDAGFAGQSMTAGHIYAVAGDGNCGEGTDEGDGGPAAQATVESSGGLAFDAAGNLVIADAGHNRVRVVAASDGRFYGQAMTAGDIYSVAGDGSQGFAGDGGPAASAALSGPMAVAAGPAGSLLISDTFNGRVRVVAGASGTFYGQAMTAGDIYTVASGLARPSGISADAAGNILVADPGHEVIRVIAASAGTFYGQPMTAGGVYVVAGTLDHVGDAGDGGSATAARLFQPQGVTADAAGNIVIADTGNSRIRVVAASSGTFYGQPMTAGDIYRVAGTFLTGYFGDGGPGTGARLSFPTAVTLAPSGDLLFCDTGNLVIRRISH